jgi:hypothetical protein
LPPIEASAIELIAEKSARTRALFPKIYEQWRRLVSKGGQVVKPVGGGLLWQWRSFREAQEAGSRLCRDRVGEGYINHARVKAGCAHVRDAGVSRSLRAHHQALRPKPVDMAMVLTCVGNPQRRYAVAGTAHVQAVSMNIRLGKAGWAGDGDRGMDGLGEGGEGVALGGGRRQ